MAKKYVQQFELGSGAFGRAVVVKHTDIHDVFVAKIIQVKNLSEVELDRCVTEVLILKACNHRNIIQYIEAFVEQECLHIVMEYAKGGDLHKRIQTQSTLGKFFTGEEILQWFVQIVLALEYIHSKGILHRDLKPQNVFLTENNIIKLGDFGIAKVLAHGDDLASTRIGTPFYISPEICAGKQYNSSSDMWAAGCLLFELTLLRVPFNAASLSALTKNIIQCQFDQIPRTFGNIIPMLISKLIIFEPERRLTATEILKCPDIAEMVAHHRKLIPDPKKVRRSSSVRSLGGREVRKSFEAIAPVNIEPVKDIRPEVSDCNKDKDEVAKVALKNPVTRYDIKDNKGQIDDGVKAKPMDVDGCVRNKDQPINTRKDASDDPSDKTKSYAKVKSRTFSLKESVVRKLSAASPKLAETIRKQRMSVGDDTYIQDKTRPSSIDIEDSNDDVFSQIEDNSGAKRRRKGSLTYTVFKPKVCIKSSKSNDENNNNNTAAGDVNSTLLLALSMLKPNPVLARTILMDKLAYSVGRKRGEELVKIVKRLVVDKSQTYMEVHSKLLEGEHQYIPLVSMILCLKS